MNRPIVRLLAVAALWAVCGPIDSQAQQRRTRNFEGPPRLTEAGRARPAAALTGAQPCDPGTVTVKGNLVSVEVHYKLADFTTYNPDSGVDDRLMLRSYGGCKSGPLLELHPGNTLRLHLFNDLSADDPSCYANPPVGLGLFSGVGCFNTINLHTHGLHVSPAGNSDNVLLNIAPQTDFVFEINIPDDHPSGTFWYHAHRHGSTAIQVASGASGVLIVRGDRPYDPRNPQAPADIDTILHDKQSKPFTEQTFLLQQISYACFNNDPTVAGGKWQRIWTNVGPFLTPPEQRVVPAIFDQASAIYNNPPSGPLSPPAYSPFICPPQVSDKNASVGVIENFGLQLFSATIWDTNGRFTSVNGVVQPHLGADQATAIKAGEIQRWRFIHAGIHDTVNLEIVKAPQNSPIATAELTGNRQAQVKDLARFCGDVSNPQNLVPRLIPQFEIATDGLTRRTMRSINLPGGSPGPPQSNYLQPGYRSDILVVFPSEGDYCLLDQAAPKGMRPINGGAGGGQGPSAPQLLAYIHVQAGQTVPKENLEQYVRQALSDNNPSLPADVRAGLRQGNLTPWAFVPSGLNKDASLDPAPATNVQTANFAITQQGQFQINNASYDPNVVNYTRQVNTTDEWLLTAGPATPTPNNEPHIFHIHVNPFEVIDITTADKFGSQASIFNPDGTCKVFPDPLGIPPDSQGLANQYCGMWHTFRDTIFVENGYQIHVRTRYDRYIGEYVLHCHILDHEDAGMMANINIVPDLKAPGGGIGMTGMKHSR